jgi:hypothetical protein
MQTPRKGASIVWHSIHPERLSRFTVEPWSPVSSRLPQAPSLSGRGGGGVYHHELRRSPANAVTVRDRRDDQCRSLRYDHKSAPSAPMGWAHARSCRGRENGRRSWWESGQQLYTWKGVAVSPRLGVDVFNASQPRAARSDARGGSYGRVQPGVLHRANCRRFIRRRPPDNDNRRGMPRPTTIITLEYRWSIRNAILQLEIRRPRFTREPDEYLRSASIASLAAAIRRARRIRHVRKGRTSQSAWRPGTSAVNTRLAKPGTFADGRNTTRLRNRRTACRSRSLSV